MPVHIHVRIMPRGNTPSVVPGMLNGIAVPRMLGNLAVASGSVIFIARGFVAWADVKDDASVGKVGVKSESGLLARVKRPVR